MHILASHRFIPRLERTLAVEAAVDTAIAEAGSGEDGGLFPRENDSTYMESYQKSIWVYSAVSILAEVAAQVPLKIYKNQTKKRLDVTNEKIMQVLKHPNPWMSRYRLWEATISFLRLCGDSYWEVSPNKNNPEFIYLIRPDLMQIIPDARRNIKEYRYFSNGLSNTNEYVSFNPDNIVHFRSFHPFDQFYGMSSLKPAEMSIAADLLALQYQIKFYENNARPDGVFKTDAYLTDPQINRLEKKLIQFRQKLKGAFTPIILHGGLKYEAISSNLKDLELTDARKVNRQDMLSGQRVLPSVAGIQDADFSQVQEQLKMFTYTRIMPMLRGLSSDLDTLLLRYMGSNLESSFEINLLEEYVDELSRDNTLRIRLQNGAISIDEFRQALNLDPLEDKEEGAQRYILSTLMRVENAQSINDQDTGVGGRNQRPDSEGREDTEDGESSSGGNAGNSGTQAGSSERN